MSAILLGSGLNLCIDGYPSWDDLLQNIGAEFYSRVGLDINPLLKYDAIMCAAKEEYGAENTEFKIRELLGALNTPELAIANSDLFASIISSGVNTILTTNYDYNLETALIHGKASALHGQEFSCRHSTETSRSNKRYNQIGDDVRIHHIHGELNFPRSICLGITKYIGNLSKIMELLSSGESIQEASHLGRLIDSQVFSKDTCKEKTWAELLFNSNIYIVGLGLSPKELDIWWLLMRRAQLLACPEIRGLISNEIYYFPLYEQCPELDQSQFDALYIKLKPRGVVKGYWKSAYKAVWSKISRLERDKGKQI